VSGRGDVEFACQLSPPMSIMIGSESKHGPRSESRPGVELAAKFPNAKSLSRVK